MRIDFEQRQVSLNRQLNGARVDSGGRATLSFVIVWINGPLVRARRRTARYCRSSSTVAAPCRRDRRSRGGLRGSTLVMPKVLVASFWREIAAGLTGHGVTVRHFVLHADQVTLRKRIEAEHVIPSPFRLKYLAASDDAARTWLHAAAEVIDTTHL